jgi:glycosyltransferase involved in cell wall biosynthesis
MDDLSASFSIKKEKCRVIYNPVNLQKIAILSMEAVDHPWLNDEIPVIAACGRLTVQKNYFLLLRTLRLVLKEIHVRLIILGEGDERQMLESYTEELGIQSNVAFLGFQSNPFKYIAHSTVFVLSSSWEGFSLVLVEAMACGVPVISTDCPSGPNEIITDGVNGILVPVSDEKALSDAILRLIRDEALRKQLAENGRKRAEDFRIEKIIKEYEGLFEGVL